ncbi:MAG: hypothetical protein II040_03565 [Muribaculaceae bacterium]|nr:hypothetical protein [Muribaculaceae bacterium]
MSLNEQLEELNYVSQDEWFGRIKDVCRSQAKRIVRWLAVILLLCIAAVVYFLTSRYQGGEMGDIAALCLELIICFALVWVFFNNVRFLIKVDSLDSPEQLLHQHEQRIKNDRRASLLGALVSIVSLGGSYAFTDSSWWYWAMTAILIALIIIFYFKGSYLRYSDRDNIITERLQELINTK